MLQKLSNLAKKLATVITNVGMLFIALIGISVGFKLIAIELKSQAKMQKYYKAQQENANPPIIMTPPFIEPLYIPIIAIGTNGNTNCTAFIISVNYALTAAHCVEIGESYEVFAIRADNKEFVPLKNTKAEAVSSYFRAGLDMAALHGDFRDFESLPVIEHKSQIISPNAVAIGLLQKALTLESVEIFGPNIFGLAAHGQLFPGMSGGPVIDERGIVIGINSAMSQTHAIISPLHLWKHYLNIDQ